MTVLFKMINYFISFFMLSIICLPITGYPGIQHSEQSMEFDGIDWQRTIYPDIKIQIPKKQMPARHHIKYLEKSIDFMPPQDNRFENPTLTDVYYLTFNITQSLAFAHQLSYDNLQQTHCKPKTLVRSFLFLLRATKYLNTLFHHSIPKKNIDVAYHTDLKKLSPDEFIYILKLIQNDLVYKKIYIETSEPHTVKKNHDVNCMIEQFASTVNQIKKQNQMNPASSVQIGDYIFQHIDPLVTSALKHANLSKPSFSFDEKPARDIKAIHLFRLIGYIYSNTSAYYQKFYHYHPLLWEISYQKSDHASLSETLAFIHMLFDHLKTHCKTDQTDSNVLTSYEKWKSLQSVIVPGDIFHILQYYFILSKSLKQSAS